MTFHLHLAESADHLLAPLAQSLSQPLSDPFAAQVVCADGPGPTRWLAQQLSHHLGARTGADGVTARINWQAWEQLVDTLVGANHDDPWSVGRLTWTIQGLLASLQQDQAPADPRFALLYRYLQNDGVTSDRSAPPNRSGRQFALAQRIAWLFTNYDRRRPELIAAWDAGLVEDGLGARLPPDLWWQPALFALLRQEVPEPGPSQRLRSLLAQLQHSPQDVRLPPELHVFAPETFAPLHWQVLVATAEHREVHVWLPVLSQRFWERNQTTTDNRFLAATQQTAVAQRQLFTGLSNLQTHWHGQENPRPQTPTSTLTQLQTSIRQGKSVTVRSDVASHDGTVQVHACHGPTRQVEVLREVLLGLLSADPTLEPRDVVVVCPDLATFAPVVEAAFQSTFDGPLTHPGRSIPVRVLGQTLTHRNLVLQTLQQVLQLARSRVTASQVVDLASSEAVRRRFGFTDENLERVRAWTVESGVRWGEHIGRRRRYGVEHSQGTWRAGMDRLLLGVAMAEEDQRFLGAVLPVDDVSSVDVELVGRWAEFIDRLTTVLAICDERQSADSWWDVLDLTLDLLTDAPSDRRWDLVEAHRLVQSLRADSHDAVGDLDLSDVTAAVTTAVTAQLQQRQGRSGFGSGGVTVCDLESLRAIPHRVVIALGMDDAAFPHRPETDGDSVLVRCPNVQELDQRQLDRGRFLDAVTSATSHLVICYSGADERSGATKIPSVLVSELLEGVDGFGADFVTHHPLHPVDPRCFTAGALNTVGPFSFDPQAARAASLFGRGSKSALLTVDTPLPPMNELPDLELQTLISGLQHPVRALLRDRLGVTPSTAVAPLNDRLPLDLAGLDRWAPGDRILQAALSGVNLNQVTAAERRRGQLPIGELGGAQAQDLATQVEALLRHADRYRYKSPPASTDVSVAANILTTAVDLPDGRRLTGNVTITNGQIVTTVFSRLGAKHRLRAWVELLMTVVGQPQPPQNQVTGAALIGRGRPTAFTYLRPPGPQQALSILLRLIELYDEALTTPLPLPLTASYQYAVRRKRGSSTQVALLAAQAEVERGFELNVYDQMVWGQKLSWDQISAFTPTASDQLRAPDETTRFGALSWALWSDLLGWEGLR